MGRALFILFMVSIIGYVLMAVVATPYNDVAIERPTQSAPVLETVTTMPRDFNETGTLVFYPNNIGPVPYLFYQDQKGVTVAKALIFPNTTPSDFSSWTGARVFVTGSLTDEHVSVSRIVYISAP